MSSAEGISNSTAAMTTEERFATVRSIGEECIGEDELLALLHDKPNPVCYHGFEPCGRVHIAQGVMKVINVNKIVRAGCKVKILVGDHETGQDLGKIRKIGRYMIDMWKALGMNLDGVEFLWSSEEINKRADEYWPLVMDIARKNKVGRLMSFQANRDDVNAVQLLSPIMQCANILFLEVDICQMGIDQREVNVMAREYCEHTGRKTKPIILLHRILYFFHEEAGRNMLPSFKEGQQTMPNSYLSLAIFMEDNEGEVKSKIKRTFCPVKVTEGNPCLEYIEHIVFPWFGKFEVVRNEDHGSNRTYLGMEELLVDYGTGALHPSDVKPALAKAINQILQPVRDHFNKNSEAKVLRNAVKKYLATNSAETSPLKNSAEARATKKQTG